ncbi:hypothetical protein BH10BAC3_BH10BAC3_31850 [soil metagenome]
MKLENRMRYKRFVLDTNIWISYFITKREDLLLQIFLTKGFDYYL